MSELLGLKVTKQASNLGSIEMRASLRAWPSLTWLPLCHLSLCLSLFFMTTQTTRMLCSRESCLSGTPQLLHLRMMGLQFSIGFWISEIRWLFVEDSLALIFRDGAA